MRHDRGKLDVDVAIIMHNSRANTQAHSTEDLPILAKQMRH